MSFSLPTLPRKWERLKLLVALGSCCVALWVTPSLWQAHTALIYHQENDWNIQAETVERKHLASGNEKKHVHVAWQWNVFCYSAGGKQTVTSYRQNFLGKRILDLKKGVNFIIQSICVKVTVSDNPQSFRLGFIMDYDHSHRCQWVYFQFLDVAMS